MQLCRAILLGIRNHLKAVGRMDDETVGMMPATGEEVMNVETCETAEYDEEKVQGQILQSKSAAHQSAVDRRNAQRYGRQVLQNQRTYDALTHQLLDEELVRQGKEAEMSFLRQWQVYEYVTYDEAWAMSGKRPISTKWVCTNKGDDVSPNVRCRWVAREFRDEQEVIVAATAPYESIRLLLSIAATMEETTYAKNKMW